MKASILFKAGAGRTIPSRCCGEIPDVPSAESGGITLRARKHRVHTHARPVFSIRLWKASIA